MLFVVGGLYGNPFAFSAVEDLVSREASSSVKVVFNGDFNFFNTNMEDFVALNSAISSRHLAIAGNVELEISADHMGSQGCGCGYPTYVSQVTFLAYSPWCRNRNHVVIEFCRSFVAELFRSFYVD